MSAPVRTRPTLSMPCWLERNGVAIKTPARQAAWHRDCPFPETCPCPGHALAIAPAVMP